MSTQARQGGERGAASPGDVRAAFGRRVRTLRLEQDHSQEKLGELAGLHRNYVGGVERGEINLCLENVYALARGLGVDVSVLFGSEGDDGDLPKTRAHRQPS